MSKLQVSVAHGILRTKNLEQILVGTADWFKWLELNKSFRFEHDGRSFSARKENPLKKSARNTGYDEPEYDETNAYWSAYRKIEGKTRKRYIGKTQALKLERLIEVSQALDEPTALKLEKELSTQLGSREVRQLETKAWRFERSHKIALQEIEQLQNQVKELQKQVEASHKELGDYKRKFDSQQEELTELKELVASHSDAADLLSRLKEKHPKSKVSLKDIKILLELKPALTVPITSSQLPDFYEIRDQVFHSLKTANRKESKQRIYEAIDYFIEGINASCGDYGYLQRLKGELKQMKHFHDVAVKQKIEISML
ncbi:MAG: hypothetical protein AB1861_29495 [Cyanobacteriota bacterium]